MSNKCTCFYFMPFAPECHYCNERFYKYINERDIEIIKINEKNIKENKYKYKYFAKYRLYTCDSCVKDLNKWKDKYFKSSRM